MDRSSSAAGSGSPSRDRNTRGSDTSVDSNEVASTPDTQSSQNTQNTQNTSENNQSVRSVENNQNSIENNTQSDSQSASDANADTNNDANNDGEGSGAESLLRAASMNLFDQLMDSVLDQEHSRRGNASRAQANNTNASNARTSNPTSATAHSADPAAGSTPSNPDNTTHSPQAPSLPSIEPPASSTTVTDTSNEGALIIINYVFSDENNSSGSLVLSMPSGVSHRDPAALQEFVRLATQMAYSTIFHGSRRQRGITIDKFNSFPIKKISELENTQDCAICFENFVSLREKKRPLHPTKEGGLTHEDNDSTGMSENATKRRKLNDTTPLPNSQGTSSSHLHHSHDNDSNDLTSASSNTTVPPSSNDNGNTRSDTTSHGETQEQQRPKYLSEFVSGGRFAHVAVELPCGHVFGKSCLFEWLKDHSTCPLCRAACGDPEPQQNSAPNSTQDQNANQNQDTSGGRVDFSQTRWLTPINIESGAGQSPASATNGQSTTLPSRIISGLGNFFQRAQRRNSSPAPSSNGNTENDNPNAERTSPTSDTPIDSHDATPSTRSSDSTSTSTDPNHRWIRSNDNTNARSGPLSSLSQLPDLAFLDRSSFRRLFSARGTIDADRQTPSPLFPTYISSRRTATGVETTSGEHQPESFERRSEQRSEGAERDNVLDFLHLRSLFSNDTQQNTDTGNNTESHTNPNTSDSNNVGSSTNHDTPNDTSNNDNERN